MTKETMNIFQTVQMHFALIGYESKLQPFNRRQKLNFVHSLLSGFSVYAYFLHVANTPKEYMNSMFICGVGTLINVSHISTVLKMKKNFTVIEEVEEVLIAREFYLLPEHFYCLSV